MRSILAKKLISNIHAKIGQCKHCANTRIKLACKFYATQILCKHHAKIGRCKHRTNTRMILDKQESCQAGRGAKTMPTFRSAQYLQMPCQHKILMTCKSYANSMLLSALQIPCHDRIESSRAKALANTIPR